MYRSESDESVVEGHVRHSHGRREVTAAWLRASVALLLFPAAACTSVLESFESAKIAPEELLVGTALVLKGASIAPSIEDQGVLALSPEMQDFLDRNVDRDGSANLKLHQLVSAIMDSDRLGVRYDDMTLTASETFRIKRGNCLSFSNLFVAMARSVGLNVQYQEVDVPPDWTFDNDTFVLNRHVNVYVDLGPGGKRVVDFNISDFKASYEMRRISDSRASAHYYNNMGVERMQAGDAASALWYFRRAIAENDNSFSPAWINLGTLYQRNGYNAEAKAAYLQALKASPWDLVAMSNLARLYRRMGDHKRANVYQKRVIVHRMRNPYYRYFLASNAMTAGNWNSAIGHLRYAVRKRPKEDQFCFLLGEAYLRKGIQPRARHWFAKAQEVASTDVLKREYASRADALLRGEVTPPS